MKILASILFILVIEYNIPWTSSQPLEWTDFKGKAEKNSDFNAMTYSGIEFKWSSKSSGSDLTLTFNVSSYFDQEKSWVKKGKETAYLLNHEQLHFDITELHARHLKKRCSDFTFSKNYALEVDSIYKVVQKEKNDMQELYDLESNHSINKEGQIKWNNFVKQELKNHPIKK